MEVYLIRHTTPKVEKGICYGQSDLTVTDSFEQERDEIAELLPNAGKMPLHASPLQRCHLLAKSLNPEDITLDNRLKEMNFGDWEMLPWQDIPKEAFQHWRANFDTEAPPNGESNQQLRQRIQQFWDEFTSQLDESAQVGVVSHYGVMINIVGHLLGIPVENGFRLDLGYAAVIRVLVTDKKYYKIKFLKS